MNNGESKDKTLSTKPQRDSKNANAYKQKQTVDSIAGSMLSDVERELGLEDLFKGEIKHESFDCPLNLRQAFKDEVKQNGSSVCKELQKFQLAYIATSRLKKHALGNTLSKVLDLPLTIGNLSLNQYVQSRPRRYVARTEQKPSGVCHYCDRPSAGEFLYVRFGKMYPLCRDHKLQFVDGKIWKAVKQ